MGNLAKLRAAAQVELSEAARGNPVSSAWTEINERRFGNDLIMGAPQSVAEGQALAAVWLAAASRDGSAGSMAPVLRATATSLNAAAASGREGTKSEIQRVGLQAVALLQAGGLATVPEMKRVAAVLKRVFDVGFQEQTSKTRKEANSIDWTLTTAKHKAGRATELPKDAATSAYNTVAQGAQGIQDAALSTYKAGKKKLTKAERAARKTHRRINWWLKWGPVIGIGTIAGLGALAIVVRAPKS